jgi:hypothetical protein
MGFRGNGDDFLIHVGCDRVFQPIYVFEMGTEQIRPSQDASEVACVVRDHEAANIFSGYLAACFV